MLKEIKSFSKNNNYYYHITTVYTTIKRFEVQK